MRELPQKNTCWNYKNARKLILINKMLGFMKGFNYIYGATLMQALMAANDLGIKQEQFVTLYDEGGLTCLVYYGDTE